MKMLAIAFCVVLFGTTALAQPNEWETGCLAKMNLDLVYTQDASLSFGNDAANFLVPQYQVFWDEMEPYLNSVRYGLASFSDKPISPFGFEEDYCYREMLPLTESVSDFVDFFPITLQSGRDWRESQLDALYYAAISPTLGWTMGNVDNVDGTFNLRVNVLVTDSLPHAHGEATGLPAGGSCENTDYIGSDIVRQTYQNQQTFAVIQTTEDVYPGWQFMNDSNVSVATSADIPIIVAYYVMALAYQRCDELGFQLHAPPVRNSDDDGNSSDGSTGTTYDYSLTPENARAMRERMVGDKPVPDSVSDFSTFKAPTK